MNKFEKGTQHIFLVLNRTNPNKKNKNEKTKRKGEIGLDTKFFKNLRLEFTKVVFIQTNAESKDCIILLSPSQSLG